MQYYLKLYNETKKKPRRPESNATTKARDLNSAKKTSPDINKCLLIVGFTIGFL